MSQHVNVVCWCMDNMKCCMTNTLQLMQYMFTQFVSIFCLCVVYQAVYLESLSLIELLRKFAEKLNIVSEQISALHRSSYMPCNFIIS